MLVRLSILLLSFLSLTVISTSALARAYYPVTLSLSPYAGLDFQTRTMGFKNGFGDNLFKSQYPQINLFAGIMLTEYLGLEMGYETTIRQSRTRTLGPKDINLGNTAPAGLISAQFKSNSKLYGPHLNVVGIWCVTPNYPLEIFGSLGAAFLTAQFERDLLLVNGKPRTVTTRTFKAERTVLRATGGIQYTIADCVTFRGTLGWENTSQFKLYSKEPVLISPGPQIKLKDSFIYGIGGFYSF